MSNIRNVLLSSCLAAGSCALCTAQTSPLMPGHLPARVEQAFSWLPADTETILVANKPFAMPRFKPDDSQPEREKTLADLPEAFELLPLSLFELKDGLLQNYLAVQTVEIAVEGSRHFRNPGGLGEMPYEGCQIAVLAEATVNRRDSFLKRFSNVVVRVDSVAGQKIPVFEEKLENDIWTIFVAFPKPNLVLACTNRDYLRDVLERIGGKVGRRALGDTLAEWKFVGAEAPFWGLRHYDKSQAGIDPTSPFGDRTVLGAGDRQASGIAFQIRSQNAERRDDLLFLGHERHSPISSDRDSSIHEYGGRCRLPSKPACQLSPGSTRRRRD